MNVATLNVRGRLFSAGFLARLLLWVDTQQPDCEEEEASQLQTRPGGVRPAAAHTRGRTDVLALTETGLGGATARGINA